MICVLRKQHFNNSRSQMQLNMFFSLLNSVLGPRLTSECHWHVDWWHMDWDVGKGRRGRRKRPVVRTAFLVCRTSLLRSVWIIAHRFEFASQVGIPTPPPDSFLPFWLLLICICFFFCFTVFLLFYSINNCVVASCRREKIPLVCLDLLLQNRFPATYLLMCFFSLSALSDSWRGPQQLCYADVLFLTVFVFVGFLLCSLLDLL